MAGFGITKAPSWGRAILNKFKKKPVLVKDKAGTITGVKPTSGKIPWYVSATPNTTESRARVVKTHFQVKRSEKIEKLEKQVKEGKEDLKKMVDTGQAKEVKDYKGKSTGRHFRTGSR